MSNKNHIFPFIVFLSVLLLMTSCQEDQATDLVTEDSLSIELRTILETKGGLEYFTLPMSHDYDNIPQDPNNRISSEKISLGKKLFYETGLAMNPVMQEGMQTYSCATCHVPGASFQAGIRQGIGDGGMGIGISGEGRFPNPNYDESFLDIPPIRVPNNINVAYITNAAWDGKLGATAANVGTENLWVDDIFLETNHLGYTGVETQAIAGLEFHRMTIDPALIATTYYKDLFDFSFPEYPEEERYTFETAGLAIAAFERSLLTNQAPFQDWLRGNHSAMTNQQKQGAVLFFDKAGCNNCHTGPALNSNDFHAVGMGNLTGNSVIENFSDEEVMKRDKGRGGFTGNPADDYKFKTPQIYSLKNANFLGHGATFNSIRSVIEYKNNGIAQNTDVPNSQLSPEFKALNLTNEEIDALVDFVENALYDDNMGRYVTSSVASGNCFPNNDTQSQIDMNCN